MKTKQLIAATSMAFATSVCGLALGGPVSAGSDAASYPTSQIEVGTVSPTCVSEAPHIAYDVAAVSSIGETLDPGTLTADLTFIDADGNVVLELFDQPLSGVVLWPGASIDPIDWPGWELGPNGWVVDPDDEVLRKPLTLIVKVDEATAAVTVEYPAEDSGCANAEVLPPVTTTTLAARIPETGSDGVGQSLMIGATIAVAGVGLVLVSMRRRQDNLAAA